MYSQNSKTQKKLNKKAILLLLIIIAIFIMLFSSKSPKISIIGDSNVTIELNSNYTDSGAKAKYGSKDISSNIERGFNHVQEVIFRINPWYFFNCIRCSFC